TTTGADNFVKSVDDTVSGGKIETWTRTDTQVTRKPGYLYYTHHTGYVTWDGASYGKKAIWPYLSTLSFDLGLTRTHPLIPMPSNVEYPASAGSGSAPKQAIDGNTPLMLAVMQKCDALSTLPINPKTKVQFTADEFKFHVKAAL